MKINLKVTGDVTIDRTEMINIITEHLKKSKNLQVESVITLDGKGQKIKPGFEKMVFVVRENNGQIVETAKETKPRKIGRPRAKKMAKKGARKFSRPNYGIGKELRTVMSDGKEHKLEELMAVMKPKFPKLTNKALKGFLARPEMVGQVIGDKGVYLQVSK